MRFVSVSGIGYSGSGAVIDLLSEFENCKDVCQEDEFMIPYFPDGLDDLSYHLLHGYSRFHSSDVAISRFSTTMSLLGKECWNNKTSGKFCTLTDDFLNKIVQVRWKGNWVFDVLNVRKSVLNYIKYRIKRKIKSIYRNLFKKTFNVIPQREMFLSICPEDYYKIARNYIKEIINSLQEANDSDILIINQGIPANNVSHYEVYFENIKTIVVLRDPRDMYINMKRVNNVNSLWFPHDNVEDFIRYFKSISYGIKKNATKNTLIIQFEDLIYKYNQTVEDVLTFVGDCGCHVRKNLSFVPEKSIQNTQLFKHYKEYESDIKIIEKELEDYLYKFDYSKEICHDNMF